MPFDVKSSRLFVLIAGTVVTVGAVVAAFILDRLDTGVVITIAGGWFGLLGSYVVGKSVQNGRVRSARILAQAEDRTHEEGEG